MDYGSYKTTAELYVRQNSGRNLTPRTMRKYWCMHHIHQLSKRAARAFDAREFIKGGFTSIITKGNEILQCVPCCGVLLNQAFKIYIAPLKAQYVPPVITFTNTTFCPHSIFTCFVRICDKPAIISLYTIN